jgi:hypothetical protein
MSSPTSQDQQETRREPAGEVSAGDLSSDDLSATGFPAVEFDPVDVSIADFRAGDFPAEVDQAVAYERGLAGKVFIALAIVVALVLLRVVGF